MRRLVPDASESVDLRAAYAAPAGRHVRVNFAASIDGAVSVDGRSRGLSSDADRELFHLLRGMSDVVLVGAGTVRAENYGGARPGDKGTPPPVAVVTRSVDLDPTSRLFTDTQVPPIVLTCTTAPQDRIDRLHDIADVVIAGEEDVDVARALDLLADRGLSQVICEGGPNLFGWLTAAGRLDEVCLTIAPLLAGGTASRIMTGLQTQVVESLELQHVLEEDGHLFLRYSVTR